MFRTVFRDILERLEKLDARIARIEERLESLSREPALREELERKRKEIDALAEQGLHVVAKLDEARKRVRELEGSGS